MARSPSQRARDALAPELSELDAEARRAYEADMARATAYLEAHRAAAGMMGQIAPSIDSVYQRAGADTAGYAQGFTQEMRAQLDRSAQGQADFAALQGLSPEAIAQIKSAYASGPTSDASYALGGYIPASQLRREGAGFAAAASFLPSTTLGIGQMEHARGVAEANARQLEFDDRRAATLGRLPELTEQFRAQDEERALRERQFGLERVSAQREWILAQRDARRADRAQRVQEAYLRLQGDEQKFNQWLAQEELRERQRQWNEEFSFKAAELQEERRLAGLQSAQPNAALSAKYGYIVDSNGKAILGQDGKKISVAKPPSSPTGDAKRQKAIEKANAVAIQLAKDGAKRVPVGRPGAGAGILDGANAPRGKRFSATYYETVERIEVAITPTLEPYGFTPDEVTKFAQRIANQWYKPGQAGRPRSGRTRPGERRGGR
jgi:hypothetical protein